MSLRSCAFVLWFSPRILAGGGKGFFPSPPLLALTGQYYIELARSRVLGFFNLFPGRERESHAWAPVPFFLSISFSLWIFFSLCSLPFLMLHRPTDRQRAVHGGRREALQSFIGERERKRSRLPSSVFGARVCAMCWTTHSLPRVDPHSGKKQKDEGETEKVPSFHGL